MGQIDKKLKNELFKVAVDYIYKEHLVGSQGELAEKIGISASALSRIMSNKKFVGDDTLRKMNEAFWNRFNMAYFRGEDPHCMLMEDLIYYKQHPEERLVFEKSQATPSPAPQAIDNTFLIEKAVEKATAYADKTISMLEKQVSMLEKDVEAKNHEISILKSRLNEFEVATTIITPAQWYYGINFTTGDGLAPSTNQPREVNIPSSYIGTSGQLAIAIFGFVPSNDWQTNITALLKASDESTLGQVTLEDVPLRKNITTAYSGGILCTAKSFTLSADDAWGDDDLHTW